MDVAKTGVITVLVTWQSRVSDSLRRLVSKSKGATERQLLCEALNWRTQVQRVTAFRVMLGESGEQNWEEVAERSRKYFERRHKRRDVVQVHIFLGANVRESFYEDFDRVVRENRHALLYVSEHRGTDATITASAVEHTLLFERNRAALKFVVSEFGARVAGWASGVCGVVMVAADKLGRRLLLCCGGDSRFIRGDSDGVIVGAPLTEDVVAYLTLVPEQKQIARSMREYHLPANTIWALTICEEKIRLEPLNLNPRSSAIDYFEMKT